jgi:hypothetical protein
MLLSLSSRTLEGGEFYRPRRKRLLNHCREYWYIGSIEERSKIQK